MKQVLIRKGIAIVEDLPAPEVSRGHVLVRVHHSCISVGTEMAGVVSSGLPLFKRAFQQPENVKRVLEMIADQGLKRTLDRVSGKLAAGSPTGYSAAGEVVAIGKGVTSYAVGDIVACAGAGIANHAELIDVPVNLTARVPESLTTKVASTVTLGAIALQGVRRASPALGETFVVVGLGVLGQITAQLLVANGLNVVGVDPDQSRIDLAIANGMLAGFNPSEVNYVERVLHLTDGFGADGVIITAAGKSDEIVSLAFNAARKKGRVVLVGDVSLNLKRADIYAKELDFLVSCSYGPGRYDDRYEMDGQDYPFAYVRWTENRNMQAFLDLAGRGKLNLEPLVDTVYPLDKASEAFDSLKSTGPKPMSVVLEYMDSRSAPPPNPLANKAKPRSSNRICCSIIGASSFVQGMHLPNMVKLRSMFAVRGIMSRTGSNAQAVAAQYQANYATTSIDDILNDSETDVVIIGTRHDLHAALTLKALSSGKHVLVEKPLALSESGLQEIENWYKTNPDGPMLLTGFNRRFSPAVGHIRKLLEARTSPFIANYRMNAGQIPPDHWVHGPEGGGRNIGEACHIYDLFLSLADCTDNVAVSATAVRTSSSHWRCNDNFVATLSFPEGSVCSLTYTSLGNKSHPKEMLEIYAGDTVLSIDDYKHVKAAGIKGKDWSSSIQNKGHLAMLEEFGKSLRTDNWLVPLDQQILTTRISHQVEAMINPGSDWHDRQI